MSANEIANSMPQSELIPHLLMQLWKTTHSQIFHFKLPPCSSQDPLQSLSHAAIPATLFLFLLTVVVISLHTLIIGINVMSFYFFNQSFFLGWKDCVHQVVEQVTYDLEGWWFDTHLLSLHAR